MNKDTSHSNRKKSGQVNNRANGEENEEEAPANHVKTRLTPHVAAKRQVYECIIVP